MKKFHLFSGLSALLVPLSLMAAYDNPIDDSFDFLEESTFVTSQEFKSEISKDIAAQRAKLDVNKPGGGKNAAKGRLAPLRETQNMFEYVADTESDKLRYGIYSDGSAKKACLFGWINPNDYYSVIDVPDYVDYNGESVPVTQIGMSAFFGGWGITGVNIGANIEVIGEDAFWSCNITELVIPVNVNKILYSAFNSNPLESVIFEDPSSTDNHLIIDSQAFGNTKLKSFEVPARMFLTDDDSFLKARTSFLSDNSFLEKITINPSFYDVDRGYRLEIIDNALCYIHYSKDDANFLYYILAYPAACGATKFSLTGDFICPIAYSFSSADVDEISLTSVSAIREGKVNMTIYENAFRSSKMSKLSLDAQGHINLRHNFTADCTNLETYNFAESITNFKVFDNVIYYKKDRERILFNYPSGKRDTSFTLPEDCIHIDDYGMAYNKYLESICLPLGLKSIGQGAFYNDENLKIIKMDGNGVLDVGLNAIYNTAVVKNAPEGEVLIGATVVGFNGTMPSNYVMSANIKAAMAGAFMYREEINSVKFPKDFENIPDYMFEGCGNLTELSLPENLKTIGRSAFYDTGYMSDESPYEFKPEPVKPLVFPAGIKSIQPLAFYGAYNLFDALCIPLSLDYIGYDAFKTSNCISRVSVNRSTPPSTDEGCFIFNAKTMSDGILVIPNGVDNSVYTDMECWNFSNIEHAEFSDVKAVSREDSNIEIYNGTVRSADGVAFEVIRVDGTSMGIKSEFLFLPKGIYIIRQGEETTKIYI